MGQFIKLQRIASATLALVCSTAMADYSKLVVFGDSMSDTHRLFEFSKLVFGKGFPAAPSYPGRVCDGPVAVEYLADNLKLPLQNYAFAGATSSYDTLLLVPFGMLTQVNEYLNDNAKVPTITTIPVVSTLLSKLPGTGRADPQALHMIWIGPDDFYRPLLGMNSTTSYTTLANVLQAVTSLYNGGARYFFIPLMPDLSLTPSALVHEKTQPGYVAAARKSSEQFAQVLAKGIEDLKQRYPDAHFMTFDTLSYMRAEFVRVAAEGKVLTPSCKSGGLDIYTLKSTPVTVCPVVPNHVFWDNNHPTSWVNKILAGTWTSAITIRP